MYKKVFFLILASFLAGSFFPQNFAIWQPESSGSSSSSFPSYQPPPYFWEIKLVLSSSGEYKLEDGEKSNIGHYSFVLLWTGCMEQDMDDYLIYHENSELLEWEAQEKVHSAEASHILSGNDFSGKPCFDFHYILRRDKDLHFDFQVDGFYVPQDKSDRRFYLILPSSQENKNNSSQLDYNAFLLQGSNSVSVEEEEIYHQTIEKTYCWKWKHHQKQSGEERTVFFFHSHDAKVVLTIIPHY